MRKIFLIILLMFACVAMFLVTSTPILIHVWTTPGTDGSVSGKSLETPHLNFAGEWYGEKGSWLLIRLDGLAEYRNRQIGWRTGALSIKQDTLSIGNGIFTRSWKIHSPPGLAEGYWQMRLDDEIYYRESDLTVAYTPNSAKPHSKKL